MRSEHAALLRIAAVAGLGLLLLAFLAGQPGLAAPTGATDGDAAGFARARAWFEGLGYPDLKSLPFVRVWTGGYWSTTDGRGNTRVELQPDLGWLIADDGDRFRVFTTELRIDRFRRKEVPERPEARVAYDRIDLAQTVRDGLSALERLAEFERTHDPMEARPSPIWKETDPFGDTTMVPQLTFKGFVLACACARAGKDDLALALWRRLAATPPWPPRDTWRVLDGLKDAMGGWARRNLVLDLLAQDGSWAEHLAAHRTWIERFPGHEEAAAVRADAAALERTAEAEAALRRAPKKPWATLTEAERADDLVARLSEPCAFLMEEIDGSLLAQTYGVDVPPKETWVLPRLVALGRPAIPRLVEALTDDRWTRNVCTVGGVSKGFLRPEFYVLRVADLALVALGAITGEDFSEEGRTGRPAFLRGPGDSIVTRGTAAAAQARARAWWAEHEGSERPVK